MFDLLRDPATISSPIPEVIEDAQVSALVIALWELQPIKEGLEGRGLTMYDLGKIWTRDGKELEDTVKSSQICRPVRKSLWNLVAH
ncbi:MAG: hypothetical protein LBI39_04590 [Puniceicoccales bacterium]|jgi:hypothetical protein|nr:hypothetical protein [Puniceicoccales bacterium]